MSILVLAEHDGKQLKGSCAQIVAAATVWQQPIDLLLYGHQLDSVVHEAVQLQGVARVLVAQAAHFQYPLVEDVQDLVVALACDYPVILGAQSSMGKGVLPAVAARLDIAPITDVIEIHINEGEAPVYVRPEYAGNIVTYIQNPQAQQIISVRPTAFRPVGAGGRAEVIAVPVPQTRAISQWLSENVTGTTRPDLSSARVVIAGGRSLGDAFDRLLHPLAEQLDAAIGATRACVDAGFAANDLQVGQTGTHIAPELYIAVGISGAIQHMAGVKDSKVIVAINHDPDAPIFKYADYGLVADLFAALPELHNALQQ